MKPATKKKSPAKAAPKKQPAKGKSIATAPAVTDSGVVIQNHDRENSYPVVTQNH